ncbi:Uncharacterized protein DBV15_11341, partial [Temnothorax longispinosus]
MRLDSDCYDLIAIYERIFVSSLVEMTRRDTLSYKLESGQSGPKVPPETETEIERERDCGGS